MKLPRGTITEMIAVICTIVFAIVLISNTAGTYTNKVEDNSCKIAELNQIFKEMNTKLSEVQTDVSWLKETLQFIVLRHREKYHGEKMDEWVRKK